MQSIKSKNTVEEIRFAKALWHEGIRYRKNSNTIFGKPDISIKRYKIAIFIDGEFFHGENWEQRKKQIGTNRDYWIPKIEKNMKRDKEVNRVLLSEGWIVLRFWSRFVKRYIEDCVLIVKKEIELIKRD